MAFKISIFALAVLVCQAYSQCGCGPALRPPPQIVPPVVTTSPVVATTIVDNSVSNSLANAIQLLIVSKLIESTMTPSIVSPVPSPIVYPIDVTIPPVFTPVPEIIPNCGCGDVIEVIPAMYGMQEFVPIQNQCGVTEILTPNLPIPYDGCGCSSIQPYPFELNPFAPVYGGFDYPVQSVGPYAADVLFPSSIPAQMRCNFGYNPLNMPCVNCNVEPLSFTEPCGCGGVFGNGLFY